MSAHSGLPLLRHLADRWAFRRRLLEAWGAPVDLFAARAGAVDRQDRVEVAARMADQ